MNEAKKERLRSAQRAGQIAADADLDLFLDVLYAPLTQRWLVRSGPLDDDFADALVHTALRAFSPSEDNTQNPPGEGDTGTRRQP